MPEAQWIGPSPAQLDEQTNKDFQTAMIGMANLFSGFQKNKEAAAAEKDKQKALEDAAKVAGLQKVADTLVANSPTGSISEVLKTPEGQQVFGQLYAGLGVPQEVLPSVLSQLANNPYTADQIDKAIRTQFAAEQVAASEQEAGAGKPPAPAPAPLPAQIPGAGNMGASAPAQAPSALAAAAPAAAPAATPFPPYMQQALGAEQAPAAPATPQQQKKDGVGASQSVRADAQVQAQTISKQVSPSAAAIFLKKQLDPNGIEFLTNYMKANPSEYYKDMDPKHIQKFNEEITKIIAEREKLGLESSEISVNLKTLADKNKLGLTYTKALTLQALAAANASELMTKLGGPLSMQMDSAMFTKFFTDASDRQSEASRMLQAFVKESGGKVTVAQVAQLNALVDQANASLHQANGIMTRTHINKGGKLAESPKFPDVPYYYLDKNGGFVGGFTNLFEKAWTGEGSQSGLPQRGAVQTPAGGPVSAGGVGAGTQSPQSTVVQKSSSSGVQKMAEEIAKELGY